MTVSTYTVLVIGCGNMAGGYDMLQAEQSLPLGHAKAFTNHVGFSLSACVDPDNLRRLSFQKRWHVSNGYASLEDSDFKVGQFDVISICSPTSSHAADIQSALKLKPKLIFCEKPVTTNVEETIRAIDACADQKVLLAVNYSRRWSPQVIQLKAELDNGHWGAVRSVSAVYNKGILNNGSHMFDLLLCLFGPLSITSVGQAVEDFFSYDPSVDATLRSDTGIPIQLNIASAQDFMIFEMQIITEKGVISMEDGGARWRFRFATSSKQLDGYRFLNSGQWVEPEGSFDLTRAVANLFESLQCGAPLASTGSNALKAQYLCENIKQIALAQADGHLCKKEEI